MLTDYDQCTVDGSDIEENGHLATGLSMYPGDYKHFQSKAAFSDDEESIDPRRRLYR